MTLTLDLVGVMPQDDYPDNLHRLHAAANGRPLEASLIADPTNPHNPDTVFVLAGGRRIGYVASYDLGRLHAYGIRRRAWLYVRIDPEHPDRPGATIIVE